MLYVMCVKGPKIVSCSFRYHRAYQSSMPTHRMMLIVTSVQLALSTGRVITKFVQLNRAFISAVGPLTGLLSISSKKHHWRVYSNKFFTNVRLAPLTSEPLTFLTLVF
jgi:hypothetical protein